MRLIRLVVCGAATLLVMPGTSAKGQDLLGDALPFSGTLLNLRTYADPGSDTKFMGITTQPSNTGNRDLFVFGQEGRVYSLANNGQGVGTSSQWFDYNVAVNQAIANASNGFTLDAIANPHGGLQSLAFHPDFATNGKFYTSAMVDRPEGAAGDGLNYLGNSVSDFDSESVVVEWTFDHNTQQVQSNSYRELFRVTMPVFDHAIKQIAFNHYANPGDDDYGLLYIAHGDGSLQSAIAGGGLNRDDALGKVLRVDPLQDGVNAYTTPGNPFNSDPTTLDEIYTLGHRNPHHLSFNRDDQGDVHILVAEPGRHNIEEINLLQPGGEYGWSEREGTFVHNNLVPGSGIGFGVSYLPANEADLNDFIYPVAQYDHNSPPGTGSVGSAVAGGFVIDNGSDPDLQGEYIFADFGHASGDVYQASLTDLLDAHTQLEDGESPDALTQATIRRLFLTLDDDADGELDRTANNLNTLLNMSRNDVRFGRGPNGEMFLSSKQTGLVYLVTNTILTGDYNADGFVSQGDLDLVLLNWGQSSLPAGWDSFELFDGTVSQNELDAVLLNWGNGSPGNGGTLPSFASIPEPASALLFFGLTAAAGRRSGRHRSAAD